MARCVIAAIFALMTIGLIAYGVRLLIDISKSLRADKEILKILYEQLGEGDKVINNLGERLVEVILDRMRQDDKMDKGWILVQYL